MSSFSYFERDPDGKYTYIKQLIDGSDIPEGSTYVGFDSVAFARATGQVAVVKADFDLEEPGRKVTCVDARDGRWRLTSRILDDRTLSIDYEGIGPTMREALNDAGVEDPDSIKEYLVVSQSVVKKLPCHFIGDGPMDLTSEAIYDQAVIPMPNSDVRITAGGGFIVAMEQTDINPQQF